VWSLRTKDMKLIRANPGNPRGLPESELFEVGKDPKELHDISGASHAAIEAKLAEHADFHLKSALGEAVEGGGEASMTMEECQQLMNLGYVTSCDHIQ
jgi:hypothetical protein